VGTFCLVFLRSSECLWALSSLLSLYRRIEEILPGKESGKFSVFIQVWTWKKKSQKRGHLWVHNSSLNEALRSTARSTGKDYCDSHFFSHSDFPNLGRNKDCYFGFHNEFRGAEVWFWPWSVLRWVLGELPSLILWVRYGIALGASMLYLALVA